MRQFFVIYFFLLVTALTMFGFRGCKSTRPPLEMFPDMDRQNKFHAQAGNAFFGDGRTDRPRLPGTTPFITEKQEEYPHIAPDDRFREDAYIATGMKAEGEFGHGFPVEVNMVNLTEGQRIYNIFCTACHGESGNGAGVVADPRYGYPTIVSLLLSRIVEQPDGEIFNTITHGKNTMGAYGYKIRTEDRWKVVMYMRALQRAANATVEDVPQEHKRDLGL